jgi:hypothetical protein
VGDLGHSGSIGVDRPHFSVPCLTLEVCDQILAGPIGPPRCDDLVMEQPRFASIKIDNKKLSCHVFRIVADCKQDLITTRDQMGANALFVVLGEADLTPYPFGIVRSR